MGRMIKLRRKHVIRFAIALFACFGMLSGSGFVHALSGNSAASLATESRSSETKNHCHITCLSLNTQKQNRLKVLDDDADPNPFINTTIDEQTVAIYYTVLLAFLALAFLQRRPPDLLAMYAYRRN